MNPAQTGKTEWGLLADWVEVRHRDALNQLPGTWQTVRVTNPRGADPGCLDWLLVGHVGATRDAAPGSPVPCLYQRKGASRWAVYSVFPNLNHVMTESSWVGEQLGDGFSTPEAAYAYWELTYGP